MTIVYFAITWHKPIYEETVKLLLPGIIIESIGTGFGGCKTRFPSRGGVSRLINSIFVGSLEAACRRTMIWVCHQQAIYRLTKIRTITSELFTNWDTTNFEDDTSDRYTITELIWCSLCLGLDCFSLPCCPELEGSFSFSHTSLVTLTREEYI